MKVFLKAISLYIFTLVTIYSQEISILSPQIGENIASQSPFRIVFISPYNLDSKIEYSIDNRLTWNKASIKWGSSGSENNSVGWSVPSASSDSCYIKISNPTNALQFALLGPFTIFPIDTDSICINQIKYFFRNDGSGATNPKDGFTQGLLWPGGENAFQSAVFQDGFTIGGVVNGKVYANGSTRTSGMIPGIIKDIKVKSNPRDSLFKIWKIRRNWENLDSGPQKNQLEYDYKNWPGKIGAPFVDINNNNEYDPTIDHPKFLGDETNWFVCNDFDSSRSFNHYSNFPIGLEIQYTIYGYNTDDFLKDVIFLKYKIINKGSYTLEDAIVSFFSDFDLGNGLDDYVGCDTTLGLGFGYNGREEDNIYGIPPAIGYLLVQGPVVKSIESDSAFFNGQWKKGFSNLKMTSFGSSIKGWWTGVHSWNSKEELYNNMQGIGTSTGEPLIDPNTGFSTVYGLFGDPVTGTGWYEGEGFPGGFPPYDRAMHINSGCFTLAPSDTQEVVIAVIMASGSDKLNSLSNLKNKAKKVLEFYYQESLTNITDDLPYDNEFYLSDNYPNPFNPVTTINYYLPKRNYINISVYDILGKKISTIVKGVKNKGNYKITFDGSKLSSGVYYYVLDYGKSRISKKMLLIK